MNSSILNISKYFHLICIWILFVLFLLLIVSCSDDGGSRSNSLYGDKSRNHNYDEISFGYKQFSTEYEVNISDSSGIIYGPLMFSSYESIITTYSGGVYLMQSARKIWENNFANDVVVVAPVCDSLKNIYLAFRSGKVVSIDYSGKILWEYRHDFIENYSIFNNLLLLDSNIVISDNKGNIEVLDLEGNEVSHFNFDNYLYQTFPSFENELILPITHNVYGVSDSIVSIGIDGEINWKFSLDNSRIISTPVVSDGIIYIPCTYGSNINNLGLVFKIDGNGNLLDRIELSVIPRYVSIDSDSTVYIAAYNVGLGTEYESGIFAFDKENNLIWKKYISSKVISPIYVFNQQITFHSEDIGNGFFVFNKSDGNLINVIQLNDREVVNNIPGIYKSNIYFSSSQSNKIISILE